MEWLEQNLDAYRIIAEILDDLRETVRDRLGQIHGNEWYKNGLPEGLLDRLVERKEQEKAIDWYESEYQQIMNYALFQDILEILENNPDAFPQITGLAPTSALLNARFLELEVMRAKLGRARPISETELSFLGTFHLRFRKAIEEFRTNQAAAQQVPAPEPDAAAPPADAAPQPARVDPPPVQPVTPPDPEPPPATPPPSEPTPAPAEAASATEDSKVAEESKAADGSSTDEIFAPPANETAPPPAEEPPAEPTPPPPRDAAVDPEPPAEQPAADDQPVLSFEDALDAGDSQIILRELYKEVTAIAEGIWTKDIPPPARIWEKVSVSSWYETNFSELGLRPASDFYDIISKVDRRMREGSTKEQLQDYLKEANFAQILLALRDMFQKNHI